MSGNGWKDSPSRGGELVVTAGKAHAVLNVSSFDAPWALTRATTSHGGIIGGDKPTFLRQKDFFNSTKETHEEGENWPVEKIT